MYIGNEDKKYANGIAEKAGAKIPGDTNALLIAFPVLEALIARVEELERRLVDSGN